MKASAARSFRAGVLTLRARASVGCAVARVIDLLELALGAAVGIGARLVCCARARGDGANDRCGGSSSFLAIDAQSKVKGVVAVAGCMAVWRLGVCGATPVAGREDKKTSGF